MNGDENWWRQARNEYYHFLPILAPTCNAVAVIVTTDCQVDVNHVPAGFSYASATQHVRWRSNYAVGATISRAHVLPI